MSASERDRLVWAEDNVGAVREAMDAVATITRRLTEMRVSEWITDTTRAASAPAPRFFFQRGPSPESFKIRLEGIVPSLLDALQECLVIQERVAKALQRLPVQSLALLVVAETVTDSVQRVALEQRARLLMQSAQSGVTTAVQIDHLRALCVEHKRSIDQLLSVTIPNWTMARARE